MSASPEPEGSYEEVYSYEDIETENPPEPEVEPSPVPDDEPTPQTAPKPSLIGRNCCTHVFVAGKRRGTQCGRFIRKHGSDMCAIHTRQHRSRVARAEAAAAAMPQSSSARQEKPPVARSKPRNHRKPRIRSKPRIPTPEPEYSYDYVYEEEPPRSRQTRSTNRPAYSREAAIDFLIGRELERSRAPPPRVKEFWEL